MTAWPRVWVNVYPRTRSRQVSQRAVAPGRVVEVLDVVSDGHGQLDVGPPLLPVQQLDLHGAPERLHRGVVVAVADCAHRADQPETPDVLGEGPGGELAAVVGVDDRRRRRRPRGG